MTSMTKLPALVAESASKDLLQAGLPNTTPRCLSMQLYVARKTRESGLVLVG